MVQIPIQGINRNEPDATCKDGVCDEIINLRLKDGAWRPVGMKELYRTMSAAFSDIEHIYKHPATKRTENVPAGTDDNCYVYFDGTNVKFEGGVSTVTLLTFRTGEIFVNFSHLGNVLMVTTNLDKYFFLYNTDGNGSYTQLDDVPQPSMHFTHDNKETDLYSDYNTYEYALNESVANLHKLFNDYSEKGLINGHVLLRTAWKLWDGSYIHHSDVHHVEIGRDLTNPIQLRIMNATTYYFQQINVGIPQVFYDLDAATQNILQDYKGIITGLAIFMTPPVSPYTFPSSVWDYPSVSGDPNDPAGLSAQTLSCPQNEAISTLLEGQTYYFVKEFSLEELLETPSPVTYVDIEIPNILTIESRNDLVLPINNYTNHKILGDTIFNYNDKLHLGNITTKFYDGYDPMVYTEGSAGAAFQFANDYGESGSGWTLGNLASESYYVEVVIETDDGDKTVLKSLTPREFSYSGNSYLLMKSVFTYPDSRATKFKIYRKDNGTYSTWGYFNLKPHPLLNLSYWGNYNGTDNKYYLYPLDLSSPDATGQSLPTEDNLLLDKNRVQVSRLKNPFVYPAENSYRVGSAEDTVLKLTSVLQVPLSEGQFGQFPVYVFMDTGVWVLEQGDGDVLYVSANPLINDVCNNADSITPVKGGVIFSVDEGLIYLSGRSTQELPKTITGDPSTYLRSIDEYEDIVHDNRSPNQYTNTYIHLSTVDFVIYASGAKFAYDYKKHELIISNPNYAYTYIYSMDYQVWFKIEEVFEQFVFISPGYLGLKNVGSQAKLYDISSEMYQDSDYDAVECLIQTRPIKLSGSGFKRIRDSYFRSHVEIDNYDPDVPGVVETKYCALYLFGSVDGKTYKFLNGREITSTTEGYAFDDIKFPKVNVSIRYLIVVFACKLLEDTTISHMEIDFENKYAKKLR